MVLIIVANGHSELAFDSKAKKFENFEKFFFGTKSSTKIFDKNFLFQNSVIYN